MKYNYFHFFLKITEIFRIKKSSDTPWKAHHGHASLKQIAITAQQFETNEVFALTSNSSKTYVTTHKCIKGVPSC